MFQQNKNMPFERTATGFNFVRRCTSRTSTDKTTPYDSVRRCATLVWTGVVLTFYLMYYK